MKSLRNPLFLLRWLLEGKNRRVSIFLLRGGLGNQLHQIAAAAYFSRFQNVQIIFYDHDLKSNLRDGGASRFLNLNLDRWFRDYSPRPSVSKGIFSIFIRIAISLNRRFGHPKIFHEEDLVPESLNKRFMLVQDYFMNKKYVDILDSSEIIEGLQINKLENDPVRAYNECAIHLRLTDYKLVDTSPLDSLYYARALEALKLEPNTEFSIFSDDLEEANLILHDLELKNLNYPEEIEPLSPEQLLIRISRYPSIIASRSSICWWACVLATHRDSQTKVVCPWPKILSFDNWLNT